MMLSTRLSRGQHRRRSDLSVCRRTMVPGRAWGIAPVAFAFDIQAVCRGFVYALSKCKRAGSASGQAERAHGDRGPRHFSRIIGLGRTGAHALLFWDGAGSAADLEAQDGDWNVPRFAVFVRFDS